MKKGFTLIELLVVVLIIGILSAVALPQYTKAVEKARSAEAMAIMGSMMKAVKAARLAHPDGAITVDMLDITPAGNQWETKNFVYNVPGGNVVQACRKAGNKSCAPGKIPAIKAWRALYGNGAGLKEAKECVDGSGPCTQNGTKYYDKLLSTDMSSSNGAEYMLFLLGDTPFCGGITDMGKAFCKTFNASYLK